MKPVVWICVVMAVVLFGLLNGCGNSDGSVTLDKSQTAALVELLGTYEGDAHPRRIMGAMMTGTWTVKFLRDDNGALKCKASLRLHDSENGWGNPSTATADVRLYKGSATGEYSIRVEGAFSESAPHWTVDIDGVALASSRAVDTITLFDMDSYELTLHRK